MYASNSYRMQQSTLPLSIYISCTCEDPIILYIVLVIPHPSFVPPFFLDTFASSSSTFLNYLHSLAVRNTQAYAPAKPRNYLIRGCTTRRGPLSHLLCPIISSALCERGVMGWNTSERYRQQAAKRQHRVGR